MYDDWPQGAPSRAVGTAQPLDAALGLGPSRAPFQPQQPITQHQPQHQQHQQPGQGRRLGSELESAKHETLHSSEASIPPLPIPLHGEWLGDVTKSKAIRDLSEDTAESLLFNDDFDDVPFAADDVDPRNIPGPSTSTFRGVDPADINPADQGNGQSYAAHNGAGVAHGPWEGGDGFCSYHRPGSLDAQQGVSHGRLEDASNNGGCGNDMLYNDYGGGGDDDDDDDHDEDDDAWLMPMPPRSRD